MPDQDASLRKILRVEPFKLGKTSGSVFYQPFGGERGSGIPEIISHLGRCEGILTQLAMPGWVGGNHVHQVKREISLVYFGEFTFYIQNPETRRVYARIVPAGCKVFLPEKYPHAVQNHTEHPAMIIEAHNYAFVEGDKNDIERLADDMKLEVLYRQSGKLPERFQFPRGDSLQRRVSDFLACDLPALMNSGRTERIFKSIKP